MVKDNCTGRLAASYVVFYARPCGLNNEYLCKLAQLTLGLVTRRFKRYKRHQVVACAFSYI